jgi:hypothetical protein
VQTVPNGGVEIMNEAAPKDLVTHQLDIMERMLQRGVCPFDGQHISPMLRAACPVCSPPKAQEKSRYED